ncbi:porin [Vibrio hepatarius]|uniref:porin n=1 Tax=Vibrio hepatarius TaxID=171383 RepID=UPI003735FAC9
MKKTILAVLLATSATSVAAGDIYSTDTTNVALKGEVDAYLATTDIKGTKTDLDVNVWAKVQMDVEQKLTEDLTSFASFEIESGSWYDGTNNSAKFDDVHIGIKSDNWGVAIGEVGDVADSADAIEKDDITNEGNYMGSAGGHHRESKGNGIVAKTKFGPMTFVADVNTAEDENTDATFGFSADYANDVVSVGASFVQGETDANEDYELYGVSASTEFNGLYLAATYADFKGTEGFGFYKTSAYAEGSTFGLAASYSIQKTRIYTTYANADVESNVENGNVSNFVVGADYSIASNILAFAEYQQGDADWATDDSMTVVTGVYYSF